MALIIRKDDTAFIEHLTYRGGISHLNGVTLWLAASRGRDDHFARLRIQATVGDRPPAPILEFDEELPVWTGPEALLDAGLLSVNGGSFHAFAVALARTGVLEVWSCDDDASVLHFCLSGGGAHGNYQVGAQVPFQEVPSFFTRAF